MKHSVIAFLSLAFVAVASPAAQAAVPASAVKAFPDFLSLRSEFLSQAITAPPARALAFKPVARTTLAGRVRVSVEREGDYFFVMFLRERDGAYPYGSRGNVIIKRDAAKGFVARVIWYLSDDGTSFVSLTPKNERTIVDYVVGGAVARSSLMLSRLVYQLFTGSFSALYGATASALDWSLVLGPSGPAESAAFAEALASATPSPEAAALVDAAADFGAAWRYLELAGAGEAQPVELTDAGRTKAAVLADARDPGYAPLRPWSEKAGLPVEALMALMIEGIGSGNAYIALLEAGKGVGPSAVAVVPFRRDDGSYELTAVEASSRKAVSLAELLAERPGASARLFTLPLPSGS